MGILTAARSQEIRGARHSEVDVRLKRWTIPTARMKAEKESCRATVERGDQAL
jgi:hypothetical protein